MDVSGIIVIQSGELWIILWIVWITNKKAAKTMLIGEFTHSIDKKRRLAIPAKFRKEIGKGAVVTRGLDRCLFLYPMAEWNNVAEKLSSLPTGKADIRDYARLFLAGASDVILDSLGRILIPDYLKNFAGLQEKVVITGVYKRLEIWDAKAWEAYKSRIEKETDSLAGKLGELGVY